MPARRYEITDCEWSILQPLLPNKPRGVPRSGPRFWDQGLEWSRVLIRHCDGGSDGEDKTEV